MKRLGIAATVLEPRSNALHRRRPTANTVFSFFFAIPTIFPFMPTPAARFHSLGREFDSLIDALKPANLSVKERTQLLRRMKVLIAEIDALISYDLPRDIQDATNSPHPERPIAES
jgi:hypothetical protein